MSSSATPHGHGQDLPPPGGFTPLHYKRNIPSKGPSGAVLLAGVTTMIGVGLYLHRRSVHLRLELDREKVQSRLHLQPLIQAEIDREILRQEARLLELMAMAKEKGYEGGGQEEIYNDKKNYIRSTFLL